MKKEIDLDDSKMFDNEYSKNELSVVCNILKRMFDGEPKNVNPLTEIPEPQMRLFGYSNAFNSAYFDTEEEIIKWLKNHNIDLGNICVMDYLGTVAGRSDVIRLTYKNGKSILYTACDEDGYGIYNAERSTYRKEFVWEYNYGSISDEYAAFRDRGIVFENDIYVKIEERNKKILSMFKENRQQVLTKKNTCDKRHGKIC